MPIFGQHTAAELLDLISNKDYIAVQALKTANASKDAWKAKSEAGFNDWVHDWKAFMGRYIPAKKFATLKITDAQNTSLGIEYTSVEDAWIGLINSLHVDPSTADVLKRGDFTELVQRVNAISPVDVSGAPQPKAVDPDLEAMNAGENVLDWVEQRAKDAKKIATSPWFIGGVFAVIGLGIAYITRPFVEAWVIAKK